MAEVESGCTRNDTVQLLVSVCVCVCVCVYVSRTLKMIEFLLLNSCTVMAEVVVIAISEICLTFPKVLLPALFL